MGSTLESSFLTSSPGDSYVIKSLKTMILCANLGTSHPSNKLEGPFQNRAWRIRERRFIEIVQVHTYLFSPLNHHVKYTIVIPIFQRYKLRLSQLLLISVSPPTVTTRISFILHSPSDHPTP